MKVVVNKSFGGFGLSQKAYERLVGKHGIPAVSYYSNQAKCQANHGDVIYDKEITECDGDLCSHSHCKNYDKKSCWLDNRYWEVWLDDRRDDPRLVETVEFLGKEVNDRYSELKIVEVPDDVEWEIDEYDGNECVREKSRCFG